MTTTLSNRQRKAQRKAIGTRPVSPAAGAVVTLPEPARRKTGLEWLLSKKRITPRQFQTGERYGADFRLVSINGVEPIRSCLDDTPRAGGGRGTAQTFAEVDLTTAERLHAARQAIGFHADMTAACDAICGKGFTPREINPDQREAAKIERTLQLALDLMSHTYPLTNYLKRA